MQIFGEERGLRRPGEDEYRVAGEYFGDASKKESAHFIGYTTIQGIPEGYYERRPGGGYTLACPAHDRFMTYEFPLSATLMDDPDYPGCKILQAHKGEPVRYVLTETEIVDTINPDTVKYQFDEFRDSGYRLPISERYDWVTLEIDDDMLQRGSDGSYFVRLPLEDGSYDEYRFRERRLKYADDKFIIEKDKSNPSKISLQIFTGPEHLCQNCNERGTVNEGTGTMPNSGIEIKQRFEMYFERMRARENSLRSMFAKHIEVFRDAGFNVVDNTDNKNEQSIERLKDIFAEYVNKLEDAGFEIVRSDKVDEYIADMKREDSFDNDLGV